MTDNNHRHSHVLSETLLAAVVVMLQLHCFNIHLLGSEVSHDSHMTSSLLGNAVAEQIYNVLL